MVSPIVKEQRSEIITSVLTEGLKTGADLQKRGKRFYASNDGVGNCRIYTVTVAPPSFMRDADEHKKHLDRVLYYGIESVFPVLAERPQDDVLIWHDPNNKNATREFVQANRAIIEDRMNCGLFVVMRDDISFDYYQSQNPDSFMTSLIPQSVWDDFRHPEKEALSRNVMLSRRSVVRSTLFGDFQIPDIEELLVEILEKERRFLRVSAVRLPTEDDLITYRPRAEEYAERMLKLKSSD